MITITIILTPDELRKISDALKEYKKLGNEDSGTLDNRIANLIAEFRD